MKTPHHRMETFIATFLRLGVFIAAVFLLIGITLQFRLNDDPFLNFTSYDAISLPDLLNNHLKNRQWGALTSYLGLAILICLPLLRVIFTFILFTIKKDFKMSLLSFLVLLSLALSIGLGIKH